LKWDLRGKWDHRADLLQVVQRDRDQVNQVALQQMIWQDRAEQVQDQMDNQMYQDQVYNQVDQVDQAKELGEMDHHHQVGRDQNLTQQVGLLQVDLLQVDLIWDQMGLQADLLRVNQVDLLRVDQIWIQ
jgi:hypothetical protein